MRMNTSSHDALPVRICTLYLAMKIKAMEMRGL